MCDSVVAVGSQTAAGVTLFGKNSDRKRRELQPLVQGPEAWHPPGARLRATHIEIDQTAHTFRTLGHSPDWVWGYEHGVNEHALAIGNHTVFSNEPVEETPGLIGMDLVRLALERARSAREGLDVITGLLARHGQGGAALAPDGAAYHNSFLLADPREAWLLETSNRRWAARRVTRHACSNHFALRSDWEIASDDLEPFARGEDWWTGEGRLDVAAAYRNPHVPARISEGRARAARARLDEGAGRLDVADIVRLLRDHDGEPVWSATDATPDEERFFTVCAHSDPVHWTTASLVTALPEPGEQPWPVWISFGTPCCGVFLPVYLDGVIPARLAGCGPDDAWQIFSRLNDAVSKDPVRHTPAVRAAFAPFEERAEAERIRSEGEAAGDPARAPEILSALMERTVEDALSLAGDLGAAL